MRTEDVWSGAIRAAAKKLWGAELEGDVLEPPSDPKFGDATCSAPMKLAKALKKPPRAIAEELAKALREGGLPHLEKVDIAGAGYVNLTASSAFHAEEIVRILAEGADYGRSSYGGGRKVLVEHCSANPTGPLHIAHGRQAAVGDSLASILDFAGFQVAREFYVNDTGNQVEMLGKSILWRLHEKRGVAFSKEARGPEGKTWLLADVEGARFEIDEENAYKGDYIRELAAELEKGPATLAAAKRLGLERLLAEQKKDLEEFRVRYDRWQSEAELHASGKVDETLNQFTGQGLTYEKDGAVFAKFKDYGDTDDRPLVKSDGQPVYRLPDIAYHKDKFERGFQILIDLWGPDHHAHIANVAAGLRMLNLNLVKPEAVKPGTAALPPDQRPVAFEVLIIQYCKLLKNGQEVKMSKRAASYVTLRELMDEVGVDATRFFFAMRKPSSHLDFDMDLAVKREKDNPVYYAQYAHARIASIWRKGLEESRVDPADLKDGMWRGRFDGAKLGADELEILKAARQIRRRIEVAAR
ncbi:MAG TPA: arginine--tRNA ligase, partial [Planctomycetota bacterium]